MTPCISQQPGDKISNPERDIPQKPAKPCAKHICYKKDIAFERIPSLFAEAVLRGPAFPSWAAKGIRYRNASVPFLYRRELREIPLR